MHISGTLKQDPEPVKQDFDGAKQDSETPKQDFDQLTGAGISVRTANNVLKLLKRFGFNQPFGRTDVVKELDVTKSPASEILNKLLSVEAILPAPGSARGKYRFNKAFFN